MRELQPNNTAEQQPVTSFMSLEDCVRQSLLHPNDVYEGMRLEQTHNDPQLALIESLQIAPDSIDESEVIELQKSLHEIIADWHSQDLIEGEGYAAFAREIFTDLTTFAGRIKLPQITSPQEPSGQASHEQPDLNPHSSEHLVNDTFASNISQPLRNYLLGIDTSQFTHERLCANRSFSPISFLEVLTVLRDDLDPSNEIKAKQVIENFLLAADAEFIEPATPEEEMQSAANAVERETSAYIDSGERFPNFHLLNQEALDQLAEIYNPNNLLAIAIENSSSSSTISLTQMYEVFRYGVILSAINNQYDALALDNHTSTGVTDRHIKVGARTWAGYLHEYGFAEKRIDTVEFQTFCDTTETEMSQTARALENGRGTVYIDGVPVEVHRIIGRIVTNEGQL